MKLRDARRARAALARRLGRDDGGQELVELAFVLPVLLIVLLGILEFGHMLDSRHTLSVLSREGANIASRGAPLQDALDVTMQNGGDISLGSLGGGVVSRVQIQDETPRVMDQVASTGYETMSRLGPEGQPATSVASLQLPNGKSVYVVELFYDYQDLTPLGNFLRGVVADTMYDRAIY